MIIESFVSVLAVIGGPGYTRPLVLNVDAMTVIYTFPL